MVKFNNHSINKVETKNIHNKENMMLPSNY
uniref:Uncharacterized protein n=1 Tax=Tetranychus urticae TaxID=32264 RepID=T1L128_TETUR